MQQKIKLVAMDDAARQLNTTPLNVLMHIKRGLLKGQECDSQWFVLSDSLERYMIENGSRGSQVCQHKKCSCASSCQ